MICLRIIHSSFLWTLDGTYSVVSMPFRVMYTIQAYVKTSTNVRLFPCVFSLQTHETTTVYKDLLNAIFDAFPEEWGPPV